MEARSSLSRRGWKGDLARLIGAALGTVIALTAAGWPGGAAEQAWIALGGAIVGFAVCVGVEYIIALHVEVRRLRGIERELDAQRVQIEQERKLYRRQVEVAQREAAINAVWMEVWNGAFREAMTGHVLPLDAVLARADAMVKAKNLDKPLPDLPV